MLGKKSSLKELVFYAKFKQVSCFCALTFLYPQYHLLYVLMYDQKNVYKNLCDTRNYYCLYYL